MTGDQAGETEADTFTIRYPARKEPHKPWTFPLLCACCGAQADVLLPERCSLDEGNKVRWVDLEVPYCRACKDHVDLRDSHRRGVRGLSLGIGAVAGIVTFSISMMSDPNREPRVGDALLGASFVAVIAYFVASGLLGLVLTRRADPAASAMKDRCSTPLLATLRSEFRLIGDGDLLLDLTCACPGFAREFTALNGESLEVSQHEVRRLKPGGRGTRVLGPVVRKAQAPS